MRRTRVLGASSPAKSGQAIRQLKNKLFTYETSHEGQPHTQENDCNGEFHLAIKKQIIDR
jgi:hypothetical protein